MFILIILSDNSIIPVLRVATFAPKKFDVFINVLSVYKNVIAAYKWDYLIVDVSGNGYVELIYV